MRGQVSVAFKATTDHISVLAAPPHDLVETLNWCDIGEQLYAILCLYSFSNLNLNDSIFLRSFGVEFSFHFYRVSQKVSRFLFLHPPWVTCLCLRS